MKNAKKIKKGIMFLSLLAICTNNSLKEAIIQDQKGNAFPGSAQLTV